MPARVPAGMFGQVQAMGVSGQDPRTGRPFIHFSPYAGGWGARASKDGVNALCALANGDNYNVPCEVVEAEFPLMVERYELIRGFGRSPDTPRRLRGADRSEGAERRSDGVGIARPLPVPATGKVRRRPRQGFLAAAQSWRSGRGRSPEDRWVPHEEGQCHFTSNGWRRRVWGSAAARPAKARRGRGGRVRLRPVRHPRLRPRYSTRGQRDTIGQSIFLRSPRAASLARS